MLDLKYLRAAVEEVANKLSTRGYHLDQKKFLHLDRQRKSMQTKMEALQQRSNQISQMLGHMKREQVSNEKSFSEMEHLTEESRKIKWQLKEVMASFEKLRYQFDDFLIKIPNLPHISVPLGSGEKDNQMIRQWSKPTIFDFEPKDHVALMPGAMDFDSAAKLIGSRFVVLRHPLAKLQRALIQLMLDIHTEEHGYEEVMVPYLVNAKSLEATGQLPLFEEDLFQVKMQQPWYLIPTAEVPVTNLARDIIFSADQLPRKYVSYTSCFRSEAGSYGRDVRGMLRQHQFEKVELVQFVQPHQSEEALALLTQAAEKILQRLELPYRVMSLCTQDLGFASTKTYDIEVWLPGQSAFREIASCSNMGDFQARRLQARWRCPQNKRTQYIHTLNGSGLAVGRTLVALLENHQQSDGSIRIPIALQPYMGNRQYILPN